MIGLPRIFTHAPATRILPEPLVMTPVMSRTLRVVVTFFSGGAKPSFDQTAQLIELPQHPSLALLSGRWRAGHVFGIDRAVDNNRLLSNCYIRV